VAILLIQSALFLIIGGLFVAAVLIDRSALRARDYLLFESRAVLSQRLTVAGFALLIVQTLVGTPLLGAVFALVAAAWTLWWLPTKRRRFTVAAESVFAAPPEAVASVMFDISQQPKWMESVVEAVLETPGMLRAGSAVRQKIRLSGHELTAKLVVTEHVPYELLVMVVQVRYGQPFDRFEVVPREGGSLVRYGGGHDVSLVNAILGGWRYPSLRKQFVRRRGENLERLRQLVKPGPLGRAV
jgi:hypothetical protein